MGISSCGCGTNLDIRETDCTILFLRGWRLGEDSAVGVLLEPTYYSKTSPTHI